MIHVLRSSITVALLTLLTVVGFSGLVAASDVPVHSEQTGTTEVESSETGGPSLQAEGGGLFDFGVVRSEEISEVKHRFKFRNTGSEVLTIGKIKPSCGCTAAIASATRIAPGATGEVEATLHLKGKRGKQSISVRTETNDPDHRTFVFRMTGTVLSSWALVPPRLKFDAVGPGERATRDVRINSQYVKGQTPGQITGLKTTSASIEAATKQFHTPENPDFSKGYQDFSRPVSVTVIGGEEKGHFKGKVLVYTDDPENATLTIDVNWSVEGDVGFTPQKVFISKVRDRVVGRPVSVFSRSQRPLRVLGITVKGHKSADEILVEEQPQESASFRKVYKISPNFDSASKATESRDGVIVFELDHPESPTLEVPYRAVVRQ